MPATLKTTGDMIAQTLARLTAEPRAADFLEWAHDELGWNITFGLDTNGVNYRASARLSDFTALIERFEDRECRKMFRGHWSFDKNRLAFYRQALEAIEQYEGGR